MPRRFPISGGTVPLFDCRDGERDAIDAFKTLGELLRLPWNGWCDRSISGAGYREFGTGEVARLVRDAETKGEKVLGVQVSNYAVSIAVAPRC